MLQSKKDLPTSLTYFDIENILRDLPRGDRWIRHLNEELLPFWLMPEALGNPIGDFPTYRNNDGTLLDVDHPRPEFQHVVPGIVFLDRDHFRSKSRQCFLYGVAYHLTGEEKYLDYAKAGVSFLREKALDKTNGGGFSYLGGKDRVPGPDAPYRTSQDLAYLLCGIGFLYYLTRDKELEQIVLDVHEYIWTSYYDSGADMFRWVLQDVPYDDNTRAQKMLSARLGEMSGFLPQDYASSSQKELVAQLDQIYGYMLLVTQCLPDPHFTIWKERLLKIAHIMMDRFYSPRTEMFWGAVTDTKSKTWCTPHTDFGHSVKAFWLISLIGSITDNYEMFISAQRRAAQIVDLAFLDASGSWSRCLKPDGTMDEDKEWWIHCELDQVAGALALGDPAYLRYIVRTYKFWFDYFIDHQYKEIWPMLSGATNEPAEGYPKQHSWKNGLHSFEHALIGYMFAQELHGEAVTLYYAWKEEPQKRKITPYFYQGTVMNIEDVRMQRQKVTFTTIH
jgi:mannose/cellobiose epimerase-like protein (N-acyl-D-glucosamine 2-epimerase family)